MKTRFFIPALVAVPRLPGKLLLLSLFLILPLVSQAVEARSFTKRRNRYWRISMKIRKKIAKVVAFGLIVMIARPQIIFAQAPPTPIRGSWDAVKALLPGNEMSVRLRNGQKLKGTLISVSDTVLTLERRKNTTDVNRGDVLRVYRVVKKSNAKGAIIGVLIGAGVGGLLGKLAEPEYSDDPGLAPVVFGFLGALIGVGIGAAISGRTERQLMYETK